MIGIYQIGSKIKPKRLYIGGSLHIKKRWRQHLVLLRKNKHHSIKLQRHYNKYGESDLIFSLLLTCECDELQEKEQFFLDSFKPWFNIQDKARVIVDRKPMGDRIKEKLRNANLGKKVSLETRQKISLALSGKKKPPRTKEHTDKIVNAKRGQPSPLKGKPNGRIPWCKGKTKYTDSRLALLAEKSSVYHRGRPSWNKNKKLSTTHIENLSKSHTGKKRSPFTESTKSKMRKAKSLQHIQHMKDAWILRKLAPKKDVKFN